MDYHGKEIYGILWIYSDIHGFQLIFADFRLIDYKIFQLEQGAASVATGSDGELC